MANESVTLKSGHVVQITYTGTGADWVYSTSTDGDFSVVMRVRAIQWLPSAADDYIAINEGGVDGPSIVDWKAGGATDTKQITFGSSGVPLHPYIDTDDCSFTTTTSTKIIFILA